jgi:ADP-ribose pyrophosphatase YjhB (NUDIX family)
MGSPPWLRRALRLSALSQNGLTFTTDPFERDRWEEVRRLNYATPKVDVRAAVFEANQILLVQERSDGCWTLPGGWCDVGEAPGVAAAREVEEESGYQVRTVKLLAVYDKLRHGHPPESFHAYKLFFRCELLGGTAATSDETTAVGFFAENVLPPLSLARVTEAQIRRMFEHSRDASLPSDYD